LIKSKDNKCAQSKGWLLQLQIQALQMAECGLVATKTILANSSWQNL
jgi:hypothetical protein